MHRYCPNSIFWVKLQLKYDANMKKVVFFFQLHCQQIQLGLKYTVRICGLEKQNTWFGVKVLFYKYNMELIIFKNSYCVVKHSVY